MLSTRLTLALAMCGIVGAVGCDTNGADDADIITEDTIMQSDVEMVEVPVETTDTSVVRTEVEIDTMVEVDTIDDVM